MTNENSKVESEEREDLEKLLVIKKLLIIKKRISFSQIGSTIHANKKKKL